MPARSNSVAAPTHGLRTRWRGARAHGVLALGLAASRGVDACSLDELLRLPVERLLTLTVVVAPAPAPLPPLRVHGPEAVPDAR